MSHRLNLQAIESRLLGPGPDPGPGPSGSVPRARGRGRRRGGGYLAGRRAGPRGTTRLAWAWAAAWTGAAAWAWAARACPADEAPTSVPAPARRGGTWTRTWT